LAPVPSRANFVLAHAGPRARELVAALARRRIAVRWCGSFGLPEHIRVAVRPPAEQARLARALREVAR
jgi:histidinol-phosphate/aromatic aminotransferase/cobyric acid decarboxylase-like protein